MMASAKTEEVPGAAGPLGKSEVEAQLLAN